MGGGRHIGWKNNSMKYRITLKTLLLVLALMVGI